MKINQCCPWGKRDLLSSSPCALNNIHHVLDPPVGAALLKVNKKFHSQLGDTNSIELRTLSWLLHALLCYEALFREHPPRRSSFYNFKVCNFISSSSWSSREATSQYWPIRVQWLAWVRYWIATKLWYELRILLLPIILSSLNYHLHHNPGNNSEWVCMAHKRSQNKHLLRLPKDCWSRQVYNGIAGHFNWDVLLLDSTKHIGECLQCLRVTFQLPHPPLILHMTRSSLGNNDGDTWVQSWWRYGSLRTLCSLSCVRQAKSWGAEFMIRQKSHPPPLPPTLPYQTTTKWGCDCINRSSCSDRLLVFN